MSHNWPWIGLTGTLCMDSLYSSVFILCVLKTSVKIWLVFNHQERQRGSENHADPVLLVSHVQDHASHFMSFPWPGDSDSFSGHGERFLNWSSCLWEGDRPHQPPQPRTPGAGPSATDWHPPVGPRGKPAWGRDRWSRSGRKAAAHFLLGVSRLLRKRSHPKASQNHLDAPKICDPVPPCFLWMVLSLGHPFPYFLLSSVTLVCTSIPTFQVLHNLAPESALGGNRYAEIGMQYHVGPIGLVRVFQMTMPNVSEDAGKEALYPLLEGQFVTWYLKL